MPKFSRTIIEIQSTGRSFVSRRVVVRPPWHEIRVKKKKEKRKETGVGGERRETVERGAWSERKDAQRDFQIM